MIGGQNAAQLRSQVRGQARDAPRLKGFGHGDGQASALEGIALLQFRTGGEVALALGVAPGRISAIAAGPNPPGGVRATAGSDAPPDALDRIAGAITAGQLVVPIAATFTIEQIRDAVTLQRGGHVHGQIVVTL